MKNSDKNNAIIKKEIFFLSEDGEEIVNGVKYLSLCLGFAKSFPKGEWTDEPDYMQWIDVDSKYPCVCRRQPDMGCWLGYAGIPDTHPLYDTDTDEILEALEKWGHGKCVHGEVTYSDNYLPNYGAKHPQMYSSSGAAWWVGFDCSHFFDLAPVAPKEYFWIDAGAIYKNANFVRKELTKFCEVLKKVERQ